MYKVTAHRPCLDKWGESSQDGMGYCPVGDPVPVEVRAGVGSTGKLQATADVAAQQFAKFQGTLGLRQLRRHYGP